MPGQNNQNFSPILKNAIYTGDVFHERHMPFTHKLKYRVFSLWLDIDDLKTLDQSLKYFRFNRWGIVSVNNRDHALRDGSDVRPWIEKAAKDKSVDLTGGRIFMLGFPRLWGYVFNPLTIFFCYGADKTLKGILYQVKNTFGEQHGYFIPTEEQGKISQEHAKVFHVSPFIPMDCTYKFKIFEPNETLNIAIHQFMKEGKILTATWHGQREDLNDKTLLRAVLGHPLMTIKVIVGIHWEALKLWIKGAKYISKPPPPAEDVS